MGKLLTIEELTQMLQISRATVYNYIKLGLPFKKMGRLTRFDENEVREWINKQK